MKNSTDIFRQLFKHKNLAVGYLEDIGFTEGTDYSVSYIALQGESELWSRSRRERCR